MEKDGKKTPIFDPNDVVYFAMPVDRNSDMSITEVDMKIRAEEPEKGINKGFDLMSLKCGMGARRYKFEVGGVKTATEVISNKDDLYQNLQEHKRHVSAALIGLVKDMYFLEHRTDEMEVTVGSR